MTNIPPTPWIDPSFPLLDLHRHLDGKVRISTILDLARQHNLDLPAWTIENMRPYVQVMEPKPSLVEFLSKFEYLTRILVDYDACRRIAYENILDARDEGIAYVELRFSPWFMAAEHGLDPEGVVEALADGARAGSRETGVKCNLIGILSRHLGVDTARQELAVLLHRREDIRALDLAGAEAGWPGELFREHFRLARDAGWGITVHAGEAAGPEYVWQALRELGATRIGHGVRAAEDPELLDYLAREGIGIECCPTSNVQTNAVRDYASHPLRLFLERGLLATINTDDPTISGIDLRYEYEVAVPACGVTVEQAHQAQRNAMKVAFLSEEEKGKILATGS